MVWEVISCRLHQITGRQASMLPCPNEKKRKVQLQTLVENISPPENKVLFAVDFLWHVAATNLCEVPLFPKRNPYQDSTPQLLWPRLQCPKTLARGDRGLGAQEALCKRGDVKFIWMWFVILYFLNKKMCLVRVEVWISCFFCMCLF